jgi:hypothetical protein
MLPFIAIVTKNEKINSQLPSGKGLKWMARRRETFNLGHYKTFSIVYNIDIDGRHIGRKNFIFLTQNEIFY